MRNAALGIAVGTGLAALAAAPPVAHGVSEFPLGRIRDSVVSVVAAPAVADRPEAAVRRLPAPATTSAPMESRRIATPPADLRSMARFGLSRAAVETPPRAGIGPRPSAGSVATALPPARGIAHRRSLREPSEPASASPPRTPLLVASSPAPSGAPRRASDAGSIRERVRAALAYPPVSRPPVDERRVIVLLGGLPADRADQIAALLAYEAMQEGAENPTDPRWRPSLAQLVAHPPRDIDADAVYQLLLAGFEGVDDDARMRLAEAWAARHDGGRYAGDIAYASLRAVFNAGDYRGVYRRAEAVAAAHPDFAVRARLLSVLADGYELENARAKATLEALKADYADSPEYPEILYMEAWLALETFREGEAKAILHRILRDHPASAAARKAAQILEAL